MEADRVARPWGVYVLVALLSLLALAAIPSGAALVAEPSGALLGMSVDLLAGSPFPDFLLPGVVLLSVLGVFPLAVAFVLWRRPSWPNQPRFGVDPAWLAAIAVGIALIIWILVQMTILQFFLQPVMLVQGLGIIGVSLLPAVRRYYRQPVPSG